MVLIQDIAQKKIVRIIEIQRSEKLHSGLNILHMKAIFADNHPLFIIHTES